MKLNLLLTETIEGLKKRLGHSESSDGAGASPSTLETGVLMEGFAPMPIGSGSTTCQNRKFAIASIVMTVFSFIGIAGAEITPPALAAKQIGTASAFQQEAWRDIPAYPLMAMKGFIKRKDVNVQFAYDEKNLYFRFDAADDDILDETPENLKNGMFLFSDCLEFFLRPIGARGYWEFHFTPKGKSGAIFFPSRGRRMPSNVAYLPFPGLECQPKLYGTLNNMDDTDERWIGICRIPFDSIRTKIPNYKNGEPLLIQVCSVAYSVYSDGDEKAQLFYIPDTWADPHYLPAWSELHFK
jgi:hypothetical protein